MTCKKPLAPGQCKIDASEQRSITLDAYEEALIIVDEYENERLAREIAAETAEILAQEALPVIPLRNIKRSEGKIEGIYTGTGESGLIEHSLELGAIVVTAGKRRRIE